MATAAKHESQQFVTLPSGEGNDKRTFVSSRTPALVRLVEMVPADTGGEMPVYTDLGEAPVGTKEIYTQHRMCGDYYCFIEGAHQVSATGDTLTEAFGNALKLARKVSK